MTDRRRLWILGGMLLVLALAVGLGLLRRSPRPPTATLVVHKDPIVPQGFANDASCAGCHASIADPFARSGMARSWSKWSAAEPIENRTVLSEAIANAPFTYRVEPSQSEHWQVESVTDATDNARDSLVTCRAAGVFALGSGHKGRSYVSSENGYLRILPVGWYTSRQAWDLNPDYRTVNPRFGRPVSRGCIGCHNGPVGYYPGSFNAYVEPLPEGIGCQRCHGPSQSHVDWHERTAPAEAGDPIARIAQLPPDRQQDVCLQCHLTSDVVILQPGKDHYSFTPGSRLRDLRSDFFLAQPQEVFRVTGHGPRSMASGCYQKSNGAMTCAFCHDPHSALRDVPRDHYQRRCLACHQDDSCSRLLAAGEHANQGDCIQCHMPKQTQGDIPHAVATEHWIQRPGQVVGSPLSEPSKMGLTPFWPDTPTGAWGFALVQTYARFGREREAELREGVRLLRQALAESPDDRTARAEWLAQIGRASLALGELPEARLALEEAVAIQPAFPEADALLAHVFDRMGRFDLAMAQFQRTIERFPWYYHADLPLAELCFRQGRYGLLLEMEEKFFTIHPDDASRLELVARAVERIGGSRSDLVEVLERALRADGSNAGLHLARGMLARQEGDQATARRCLRNARLADPNSPLVKQVLRQADREAAAKP